MKCWDICLMAVVEASVPIVARNCYSFFSLTMYFGLVLSNAHWFCIGFLDVSDDFDFGIFDSYIYRWYGMKLIYLTCFVRISMNEYLNWKASEWQIFVYLQIMRKISRLTLVHESNNIHEITILNDIWNDKRPCSEMVT